MITRVHKGGGTFGGLARYLTRDDRHAAIETVNLSSRDARTSARIMQATANDAPLLKALAGGSARGRQLHKPAHHFTGSWAPDENPSNEEMFAFGRRCLKALAFDDRQAVMVIHRDKTYRGQTRHELHVMTNRVSAENGRAAPDRQDGIRLAAVAKTHEQEQGRIYIRSRFERRPSAERERKRMRGPNGSTTPMTAFERAKFAAKKREHSAQRTPVAQRRAERTRLGRDLRQLHRLRERADRPAPAIIVPASPDLPPRPERQRMDVRIDIPAPLDVPASPDLPPRPERQRMDVRIDIPAPLDVPASPDLPPRPERQRMDVRIDIPARPAPLDVPASPDLPPRPERQRMDVRIDRPAPVDEPASPDLPPRPERQPDEDRQPDQRENERITAVAAAEAARRAETRFGHVHARVMTDATHAAAEIAHHRRPAPTSALYQAAQGALEHAAGDNRYAATPEVAGVPLAVGQLRFDLEREILDILAVPEPRHARIPPPEPEAVAKMLKAVQTLAERRIHHAAMEEGLHLPHTKREPTAAAPAAEQPAPPPADTPAAQDLERSTADDNLYNDPQAPVRNKGGEAGGVTVKKAPSRSHRDER